MRLTRSRRKSPIIPPSAVKKFLDRPLDDNRWAKELTHKQLDRMLDGLDAECWHQLMLHQKACLYLGLHYGSYAFFCDMGSGKTLISLELLQHWWNVKQLRRALVFVTSDKAFPTWEKQLKEYKITIPAVSLDADSSSEKWNLLERFGDGIIFLHYPGTVAMVCDKVQKRGKKKQEMVVNPDKLGRLLHRVDAVVLDESTRVSNHQSLTYEICEAAAKQAKFRYALAGMPFGRDPALLWPQMKLVDGGLTLGSTLGIFREAFFTKKKNYWGGPYSFDYIFKQNMHATLSKMLQHRSITYTAAECIELPPDVRIIETVRLPAETMQFYHNLVNEIIGAKKNYRVVRNVFLRMRQLSSGFLGLKDDETGDRAEMDFDENPKLERLLELTGELPAGHKCLVFYEFTHSGRRIFEVLKSELKLKPIWLWSGTKNPAADLKWFIENKDCTVAVINNRVGAYSLDGLQVANYEFHYESALSVIDRSQAEKRIVRKGQTRKCFIYDLVAECTVDAKILEYHREGKSLFDALLANPREMLATRGASIRSS